MKKKLTLSIVIVGVIYFFLAFINPSSVQAEACDTAPPDVCCNVDIAPRRNYCQRTGGSDTNNDCEHIDASRYVTNSQGCLEQWNYKTQSYACPGENTIPSGMATCNADYSNRPCCKVESGVTNCYGQAGTVAETNTCSQEEQSSCRADYLPTTMTTGQTFSYLYSLYNMSTITWNTTNYGLKRYEGPLWFPEVNLSANVGGMSLAPATGKSIYASQYSYANFTISGTAPSSPGTYKVGYKLYNGSTSINLRCESKTVTVSCPAARYCYELGSMCQTTTPSVPDGNCGTTTCDNYCGSGNSCQWAYGMSRCCPTAGTCPAGTCQTTTPSVPSGSSCRRNNCSNYCNPSSNVCYNGSCVPKAGSCGSEACQTTIPSITNGTGGTASCSNYCNSSSNVCYNGSCCPTQQACPTTCSITAFTNIPNGQCGYRTDCAATCNSSCSGGFCQPTNTSLQVSNSNDDSLRDSAFTGTVRTSGRQISQLGKGWYNPMAITVNAVANGSGNSISAYYTAFYKSSVSLSSLINLATGKPVTTLTNLQSYDYFVLKYTSLGKFFVWDPISADWFELNDLTLGKKICGAAVCTDANYYYKAFSGDTANSPARPNLERTWTITFDKNFPSKTMKTAVSAVDNNNQVVFNANQTPN